jgi:hypothetical protein
MQVLTELDTQQYQQLHQKLLCLPTRREEKKAMHHQKIEDDVVNTRELNEDETQVDKKVWNKKIL